MIEPRSELLQFRPIHIGGDPPPDWILRELDKEAVMKLAAVKAQLEVEILRVSLRAAEDRAEILTGG